MAFRDGLPLAHLRNLLSPDWQAMPQIGLLWIDQHMCAGKIMLMSLLICFSVYENAQLSGFNGSLKYSYFKTLSVMQMSLKAVATSFLCCWVDISKLTSGTPTLYRQHLCSP